MEQQQRKSYSNLPNKVRKKSKGFSSPMLTDAKDFFWNKFCFLLVPESAKPYQSINYYIYYI